MKSFKELIEGIKKWSDVRDRKLKKDASDVLKALDKGQVLGYSVAVSYTHLTLPTLLLV